LPTSDTGGQVVEPALDETFENAPGRDRWYTPWGGPPDVRSLAADAEGTVYANVHVGGVLRRGADGGWQETMDIDADAHQVMAHPEVAGLVAAATARGLAVSADGAATWTFTTDGLHGTYCRAVAVSGDRIYVSAARNVRGSQAAVYRADRDGGRLERCRIGLPEWFSTNIDTGCIAADGDTVVVGDTNGTVYRSEDAGTSWAVVTDGLARVNCVVLVPNS
jgi:hypothetical protein